MPPKIVEVIENGVCAACGACEATCPLNAVYVESEADVPEDESRPPSASRRDPNNLTYYVHGAACEVCEDCLTCSRVCPVVDGFPEDEFDNVRSFRGGKSELEGQDGAVVSAILKSLFEQGEIDCAVGIKRDENWGIEPFILTKASDVDLSKGTKYSSAPVLAQLKDAMKKYEKIAVVGVPCQAHGAALMRENMTDRIALVIGILCMESFTSEALCDNIIPNIMGLDIKQVVKMDFGGGKFWAFTKNGDNGEEPVGHSVAIKEIAALARNPCHHCLDYTAYYADISVGSVGAPDGWNSVIVRNETGEKYLNKVKGIEYMDDPKPGMFLIKKLADQKHKNNAPKEGGAH